MSLPVAACHQPHFMKRTTWCLQIHTTRQLAVGIVYSFPQTFGTDLLEALAERHGAPTLQTLMSISISELAQVTWDDVKTYLQSITCSTLQNYLPFLTDKTPHVSLLISNFLQPG